MSSTSLPPLPPGWTEHKAPTGHAYYYHAATKTSTYTRPATTPAPLPAAPSLPPKSLPPAPASLPARPTQPPPFQQQQPFPGVPPFAGVPTGPAAYQPPPFQPQFNYPPKPREKPDHPKRKRDIPGAQPWVQVFTRAGRIFYHNPLTKISLWTPPEEIKDAVEALKPETEEEKKERRTLQRVAKARALLQRLQEEEQERRMGGGQQRQQQQQKPEITEQMARRAALASGTNSTPVGSGRPGIAPASATVKAEVKEEEEEEEGSEYEEEEDEVDEHEMKRLKIEASKPVEFTEDDIAWQLQAMQEGEDYDMEGYDMGEEEQVNAEEAKVIFKELLLEAEVNPYGTWDSELSKIVDDERYTILPTTKKRKEIFSEWARERIAVLKAEKEKERKYDPKYPYLLFLAQNCNGKLYWAEFKRKFRKEKEMKDVRLSDKDREKLYREFVNHLKLSPALRENDLTKLLRSIPLSVLNSRTDMSNLPDALINNVAYHVFSPPPSTTPPTNSLRDDIIAAHIKGLPSGEDESLEAKAKAREEERRREAALREREMKIERERRKLHYEKEREREVLQGENRMVERAMQVRGREGLKAYLNEGKTEEGEV